METNLRNAFLLLSPLPQEGEGGVRGFLHSHFLHPRLTSPVTGGEIYVLYPHKMEENQDILYKHIKKQ